MFPIPDQGIKILGETLGLNVVQTAAFKAMVAASYAAQAANQPEPTGMPIDSIPSYIQPDSPDGYSKLGLPIYGKVILGDENGNNSYTDQQGNAGSFQTVEIDCAICEIEFNNQVVKTDIAGLNGSIKEFISGGDNDVTITGVFNNTRGVAPLDFITNLNKMFSAPVSIPVTNYFLNANNIYYIVVMPGTSLPQQTGQYSTQVFTIKAISDNPINTMFP